MGISMEAANALESAIDGKIAKAAAKATRANGTVTRIDKDGTPYVQLDGSDTETPAARTAAAVHAGERVGVTVSGGSMAIDGNWSAPATDDTAAMAAQSTADAAIRDAGVAASAAAAAVQSAEVAEQAAQDAQDSLKSVVQGATTVEKAVSVMQTALEAVVDYDPTTDTTQEWFWHDADGAHVLGDTSGYRNDIDSTGMDIKQVSTEDSVAHFGADGARIGSSDRLHVELSNYLMSIVDSSGEYVTQLIGSDTPSIKETLSSPGLSVEYSLSNVPLINSAIVVTFLENGVAKETGTVFFGTPGRISTSSYFHGVTADYDGNVGFVITRIATANVTSISFTIYYQNGLKTIGSIEAGGNIHSSGTGLFSGLSSDYLQVNKRARIGTGILSGYDNQTVIGKYNDNQSDNAFEIGNGTGNANRSNALAVKWDGTVDSGIAGVGANTWVQMLKGRAALYVPKDLTDSTTSNYAVGAVVLETAGGGAWAIANYNDESLKFVYISPSNKASGTNTVTQFSVPSTGILTQAYGGTGKNSLYKLITYTGTYATLNANAYTTVSLSTSATIPSGYSPVAFLKVDSGRDRASIARVGFNSGTLQVTVVNGTSTNITSSSTVTVQVLYLPTAS